MSFVIEEVKETVLYFSKGTVKVYDFISFYHDINIKWLNITR